MKIISHKWIYASGIFKENYDLETLYDSEEEAMLTTISKYMPEIWNSLNVNASDYNEKLKYAQRAFGIFQERNGVFSGDEIIKIALVRT